jgi:hypothetical protein
MHMLGFRGHFVVVGHRKRAAICTANARHDRATFGNTKFNRGIDRFRRRGRSAVRSEGRLITATHNLLKLHTHQLAIAAP